MNNSSSDSVSWVSHLRNKSKDLDSDSAGRNASVGRDVEMSSTTPPTTAFDDTDEDHLLSYFLGTEAIEGGGTPQSLQSPTLSLSSMTQKKLTTTTSATNMNEMANAMNTTTSTAASTSLASSNSSSSLLGQSPSTLNRKNKRNHAGFDMPSTPAVQFYASTSTSQKQESSATSTPSQQSIQAQMQPPQFPQFSQFSAILRPSSTNNSNPVSSSSSSSSLSSIANALVHGSSPGHIIQMQQQFQAQGSGNGGTNGGSTTVGQGSELRHSPVTPTGFIGSGSSEQMMLPPASRNTPTSSASTKNQTVNHVKYQPMVSQRMQMNLPTTNYTTGNATMNNPPMQLPSSSSLQVAHMEWLKQMNSIASGINQPGATESILPAPPFIQGSSAPNQPQHLEQSQQQQQLVDVAQSNTHSLPIFPQPQSNHQNAKQTPLTEQQQQLFLQSMQRSRLLNADILPSAPTASMIAHLQSQVAKDKESSSSNTTESKEKRERRLARNRESARQSRRRKKELLLNLRAQVSKLQREIDAERFRQLDCMERELTVDKIQIINQLFSRAAMSLGVSPDAALSEQLIALVRLGGPNSQIRRAAVDYQYSALSQTILSCSQHFMLSLILKDEGFFTVAKEHRARTIKTTGRVSSKQVGEDLTNGFKDKMAAGGNKSSISCHPNDRLQMWPLFCYELAVSLDQEEKLLQYLRRLKHNQQVDKTKRQLSIATTMISNMKNGVLYQSHATAHRNEAALLQVLTPPQSARFLQWFVKNKDRCRKVFGHHKHTTNAKVEQSQGVNGVMDVDQSMTHICQKLMQTMNIKKGI